jgi:hypothetical protein
MDTSKSDSNLGHPGLYRLCWVCCYVICTTEAADGRLANCDKHQPITSTHFNFLCNFQRVQEIHTGEGAGAVYIRVQLRQRGLCEVPAAIQAEGGETGACTHTCTAHE